MMDYLTETVLKQPVPLAPIGRAPEQVHVFNKLSLEAVNAAIAARRPLLVRGEPGTGKTQLARAAAKALGWAFVGKTIDARTEAADVLFHIDTLTRLGDAQIQATLRHQDKSAVRKILALKNYVHPGVIWWAFDWQSAQKQADIVHIESPLQMDGGNDKNGCVVLIDEIDKADIDVPNGLLEALGHGQFQPPGFDEPVKCSDTPLLMVITTNEERALPDAFLRRCLVLHLKLEEREALENYFVAMGKVHFRDKNVDEEIFQEAARQVRKDRETWLERGMAAPGLAEYLDLIRAVIEQKKDKQSQLDLLHKIKQFVLEKHPEGEV